MNEAAAERVGRHPLVRRLLALDLDPDDYVVFGSGPLLAHGVRPDVGDLDVVARGAAWSRAKELGVPGRGGVTGAPMARMPEGRINFFRDWITADWDPDELIDGADVVAGVRFARLSEVLAYKRMLMRPKDVVDIRALAEFFDRRPDLAA